MNQGRAVLSQVMDGIHQQQFRRCVARYGGEYKVKTFSCWEQFLAMSFAQLTYREGLRDIEACLNSRGSQLYHLGFRNPVARSTLADANENRDWRIYADLAQILVRQAQQLYADDDLGFQLEETAYAFDSTTIDLCLNLFPWARFRRRKGAVKLHTLLDLRGSIPTFIEITEGRQADVRSLDALWVEPCAFYVMDRGYLDYARLYGLHQASAFFVIRAKKNLGFARSHSRPFAYGTGVRSDQIGYFASRQARRDYPEKLRRVRYWDQENRRFLVFLTNHRALPALTVADLYRSRWKVELFFRWIKQHLRIKAFYGTSDNAVKTQVWIAICVYVLIAIIKKETRLQHSLHEILQVLSVNAFEKVPIPQLLTNEPLTNNDVSSGNQLRLWEL